MNQPDFFSYVVYDHPKDFPHCWVARKFNWHMPMDEILVSPTLEALREIIPFSTCMQRHPDDDPVIYEIWIP